MPSQLRVLLSILIIFIIIFMIIRRLLIPDTFGQFGHYRGDALIDNKNRELVHAGTEACNDCHSDIYEMILTDAHLDLSCEICHGPGLKHAESMEPTDIIKKGGREHCGLCHSINPARPADMIIQIDLNEHNIDFDNCIDCHNPHQVWELME